VTEAATRHREATEALKATLLARLEQGAKDMAQLREELRRLADHTKGATSSPIATVSDDAGRAAEAERKWAQLEESVQRRVAALEQALKASNEKIVPPVATPEPIGVAEKKDYAWEVVAASPTFNDFDAFSKYAIKVLGVTVKKQLPGPETVLASPFVDNRCWSFEGANGTITLRLRERIVVGSVSLQQTKKDLSFYVGNAPREFDLLDERDELLGSFVYDGRKADATQTFVVSRKAVATELVTFRFRTNHAAQDFTCVGKIRVHQ